MAKRRKKYSKPRSSAKRAKNTRVCIPICRSRAGEFKVCGRSRPKRTCFTRQRDRKGRFL